MKFNPDTGQWGGDPNNPTATAPNDTNIMGPQPSYSPPPPADQPGYVPPPPQPNPATPATGAMNQALTNAQNPFPTDLQGWSSLDPTRQNNPDVIRAFAQWLSTQSGADPSVAGQVDYLAQRIQQTGGLTAGNVGYWQTRTQSGNWTAPETGSTASPTGNAAGVNPPNINISAPTPSPMSTAANAAILQLLKTPQTVDATTVAETPEAQAERMQSQRSAEQQTAAAAEQAAQNGTLGSGGFEGIQRGILENEGAQDIAFAGSEAQTLRTQQIQQLQYGIQAALNSGQFDEAQQLQAQLAQLQAEMQRYGIDTSAGTAADQLGFNYANLVAQQNALATQLLLGNL